MMVLVNPSKSRKHWVVLAVACCMCSASIGLILNTIGLFYIPVARDLGMLVGEFAFHSTLNSLAMAFMSLSFPFFAKKIGFKPTVTAGIFLSFIGTAGMGLTENLWGFYLLGIIRGTGAGLYERVPMTILVNNWFEEKNGLALSVANSFAGIIGALFAPILTWVIASQSWEAGFFWKGLFILILTIPVIFLPYSPKPEDEGYLPYGYGKNTTKTADTLSSNKEKEFSYFSIPFQSLVLFAFLQAILIGLATHITAVGESFGLSLQTAGLMTSALMVGNIVFKLLFGSLSDSIGIFKTTLLTIVMNIIGTVLLLLPVNPVLPIAGAFFYGSSYAIASIAFPILLKEQYGRLVSNRVFPLLNFIINMGKALSITVVGYTFDFTGSYLPVLFAAVLFCGVNLLIILFISKSSKQTA